MSENVFFDHEVVCLNCGETIKARVYGERSVLKVICKGCKTRFGLTSSGNLYPFGPKNVPLTGAEDENIKEDRPCKTCKYFAQNMTWEEVKEESVSAFSCINCAATGAAEMGTNVAQTVNANLRCRFWEEASASRMNILARTMKKEDENEDEERGFATGNDLPDRPDDFAKADLPSFEEPERKPTGNIYAKVSIGIVIFIIVLTLWNALKGIAALFK